MPDRIQMNTMAPAMAKALKDGGRPGAPPLRRAFRRRSSSSRSGGLRPGAWRPQGSFPLPGSFQPIACVFLCERVSLLDTFLLKQALHLRARQRHAQKVAAVFPRALGTDGAKLEQARAQPAVAGRHGQLALFDIREEVLDQGIAQLRQAGTRDRGDVNAADAPAFIALHAWLASIDQVDLVEHLNLWNSGRADLL